MNCPNCHSTLKERDQSGVQTFNCPNCSGVWISGKALEILFRMEGKSTSMLTLKSLAGRSSEVSHRICPTCETSSLSASIVGDVEIDICAKCAGTYFDKSELEKVIPKTHASEQYPMSEVTVTEVTVMGFLAAITGLG